MSQFIGQDVNGQYPVGYTGPRGLQTPTMPLVQAQDTEVVV